jgi:hypothetical protein
VFFAEAISEDIDFLKLASSEDKEKDKFWYSPPNLVIELEGLLKLKMEVGRKSLTRKISYLQIEIKCSQTQTVILEQFRDKLTRQNYKKNTRANNGMIDIGAGRRIVEYTE